ncbi:MAG: cyclic-di-AMP receptor [Anaerolineae bacterium]|nr:cyclic-di-AMP receptor [Anaerolineae bacterium]
MGQELIDRIAITVVDGDQAHKLIEVLNATGLCVTKIDAVGGFLHESLVTLLIGLPQAKLPRFFALVRQHCPSRTRYVSMSVEMTMAPSYPMMIEARVGGATVFILPVERFVQL